MNKKFILLIIILLLLINGNLFAEELHKYYKIGLNNDINFLFYNVYWDKNKQPFFEINNSYSYDYKSNLENWSTRFNYTIYDSKRKYTNIYNKYKIKLMKEDFAQNITEVYIKNIANNKQKKLIEKLKKIVKELPNKNINYKLLRKKTELYISHYTNLFSNNKEKFNNFIGQTNTNINKNNFFWKPEGAKTINSIINSFNINKVKNNNVKLKLIDNKNKKNIDHPTIDIYTEINNNDTISGIEINSSNFNFIKMFTGNSLIKLSSQGLNSNLNIRYPNSNENPPTRDKLYYQNELNNQYKNGMEIVKTIKFLQKRYEIFKLEEEMIENKIKNHLYTNKLNYYKDIISKIKTKIEIISVSSDINRYIIKLFKINGRLLDWIKNK